MSYPQLVLPKGCAWDYKKTPKYSTTVQYPRNAIRPAVSTLQHSVVYEIELVFKYLKNNGVTYADDARYMQDFYEAMRGAYGRFIFDPSQNNYENMSVSHSLTAQKNGFIGVGDGSTKVFPLWRSTTATGDGNLTKLELIQYVTQMNGVYFNGSLVSGYTMSQQPAQLTFSSAPVSGAEISWDGSYAYVCRFSEDYIDFNEFMYELWELKSLKLTTELL